MTVAKTRRNSLVLPREFQNPSEQTENRLYFFPRISTFIYLNTTCASPKGTIGLTVPVQLPWPCPGSWTSLSPLGCQSCLSHALTALPCLAHPRTPGSAQYWSFPAPSPREVPVLVLGCPHIPSPGAWDRSWLPVMPLHPADSHSSQHSGGPGPCSTLTTSRKLFT